MPNTSRTTSVSTSKSTSHNTSKSTTTTYNTSKSTTTSWTTTWSTSRSTSRTTTYSTSYNTSHTTTYNTSWAVSTSHQTTASTTSSWNTTYYTTLSSNTTLYTNTNTTVSTALTPYSVTTGQPVHRSTTFFRPKEVSPTNLMLNLDARVSAGITTWKDQSGNNRHATPTSISSVVPSDRCAALYNFHSDATDLTGNNTGTETAITYSDGNFGQAAVFNGSSSLIAIGSLIPNTDTNVAISAWVKLNSGISGHMHITGTGITTAASEAPFRATLQYQSANTFRLFALRQVAGTYYLADNSTLTNVTMNADTWYHVVWSYNSTGRKLSTFLNGTAIDTDVAMSTSGGSVNDSSMVIGSFRSTSGPFFDGDLDQVRIFNKLLSPSEITQLYNENSSTFKKVDIFNDATGGHYNLDGTGSFYMTHFITDQNFTIGGWFYRNSAGGSAGYETLWSQGYSPSVRCQIYGADGSANGNRLYIYLNNGSSGPSYDTGIDLPTGEWFHLMKTYDLSAGTTKVYLNSTLKKTQSTITGNIYSSGNSDALFRIAKNSSNNSGYINGKISQVRVYDSVLTDAQVIDDYSTHDYLYI